jgi:hypothetical protein
MKIKSKFKLKNPMTTKVIKVEELNITIPKIVTVNENISDPHPFSLFEEVRHATDEDLEVAKTFLKLVSLMGFCDNSAEYKKEWINLKRQASDGNKYYVEFMYHVEISKCLSICLNLDFLNSIRDSKKLRKLFQEYHASVKNFGSCFKSIMLP